MVKHNMERFDLLEILGKEEISLEDIQSVEGFLDDIEKLVLDAISNLKEAEEEDDVQKALDSLDEAANRLY